LNQPEIKENSFADLERFLQNRLQQSAVTELLHNNIQHREN
jgi:hypothetical protein